MIVSLLRVLAMIGVLVVAAMIETTVAIPFVLMALFLLHSRSFSSLIFFIFASCVSLLLSAVMMNSWLLIFLVVTAGGVIFRSDTMKIQTSLLKSLLLVLIMGSIVSIFAAPVISTAYVFHSLLSAFIAAVICYKAFSVKEKKLRWKEIRFGRGE